MNTKPRFFWNRAKQRWSGRGCAHGQYIGKCRDCGCELAITYSGNRCKPCSRRMYGALRKLRGPVSTAMLAARKSGAVAPLDGSVPCVDCGRPAQVYDHRDYSRPLDVEPVCRSCNSRRGSAAQAADLRAHGAAEGRPDA